MLSFMLAVACLENILASTLASFCSLRYELILEAHPNHGITHMALIWVTKGLVILTFETYPGVTKI
jgi:hypothetical protein